ncbi:hypothetical protein DL765_008446 [Monosporascus sp. GIB2]|nr:hypothetical protein DL765_008446 [Monosporascus sp. GIB2]
MLLVAATLLSAGGSAYAQGVYDTLTVNCRPLAVQRRDPIVSPSADLLDHVHSVIGGTDFFAGMPPPNALTSAATTCDKELDHSIYWDRLSTTRTGCVTTSRDARLPELQDQLRTPLSGGLADGGGRSDEAHVRPVGHRAARRQPPVLLRGGGSVQTKSLPLEQCIDIRSQVTFPSCWNGRNLNSPDDKSHTSGTWATRTGRALAAGGVDAPDCSLNFGADGPEKPAPADEIGLDGVVLAQLPRGKIPFGETPMRVKRSRVMAEDQ